LRRLDLGVSSGGSLGLGGFSGAIEDEIDMLLQEADTETYEK